MHAPGYGLSLAVALVSASALASLSLAAPEAETDVDPCQLPRQACPEPKSDMINVHLIPHSHSDVGWLRTFAQYFGPGKQSVNHILNSVLASLQADPARRFVFAETAYLWRWWEAASAGARSRLRALVAEGRLEVAGGGWSQSDEAVVHYQCLVDGMAWGLRWVNETLGACARPTAAWQIDAFGHSRAAAQLFARMAFDGLFVGRVHFREREDRRAANASQMLWRVGRTSTSGPASEIFTHILYNQYMPPAGLCFDISCEEEPVTFASKNDIHRVNIFLNHAKVQAQHYETNNIIFTMGGDFHYWDAERWYHIMDNLIRDVNSMQKTNDSRVNTFYSTPSCYLKSINALNITWPTKQGDFFPYATGPHAFWTGYYSSRPALKYFERLSNNFLQVCKQLFALGNLNKKYKKEINNLRMAMGVLQHHDAITGTAKQAVVNDYVDMLHKGVMSCNKVTNVAINKLAALTPEENIPSWENCLQLNVSQCPASEEAKRFVVTVYNPMAHMISPYIRFPVTGPAYSVQDSRGNFLPNQLIYIPDPVRNIRGRKSTAKDELVFRAENLKPLSFHSYFVSQMKTEDNTTFISEENNDSKYFGNKDCYFKLNKLGKLNKFSTQGVNVSMKLSYAFYKSSKKMMGPIERNAGAYVFRPQYVKPTTVTRIPQVKTYIGPLVMERHEIYNTWLSKVIRVYTDEKHCEVDWLVGPIPISDATGKEVILKYSTNISSFNNFYSDSNGRQLMERERTYQPTNHLDTSVNIAGNYYPISNRILIRDMKKGVELCIITDRSEGGSSLKDGEMELMLHRRLVSDDSLGLNEHLNEMQNGEGLIVRGKHYLMGGPVGDMLTLYERKLALEKQMAPILFFARADNYTFTSWSRIFKMEFNGIKKPLPNNVHLLTLEPWKENSILLRLEHIFEEGENSRESVFVNVTLKDLFLPFDIVSVKETTLGANIWKSDLSPLKWKTQASGLKHEEFQDICKYSPTTFSVILGPMDICTFVINVKYSQRET